MKRTEIFEICRYELIVALRLIALKLAATQRRTRMRFGLTAPPQTLMPTLKTQQGEVRKLVILRRMSSEREPNATKFRNIWPNEMSQMVQTGLREKEDAYPDSCQHRVSGAY